MVQLPMVSDVQRLAAINSTGAMSATPTDALNTFLNLASLSLLIDWSRLVTGDIFRQQEMIPMVKQVRRGNTFCWHVPRRIAASEHYAIQD